MSDALWRVVDRIGKAAVGSAWSVLFAPRVKAWMDDNPATVAQAVCELRVAFLKGEL